MDDATMSKKKISAGQYTHWARPKWIRMYTYNYEFGESYYRPQVRYVSSSRYSSGSSSSASSFNSSASYIAAEKSRNFSARRRAISPPKAMSFIERWTAEPFYGRGFIGRRSSSLAREESNQRENSVSAAYRSARAVESSQRESSAFQASRESRERELSSQYRSTRAESSEREAASYHSSELRSRRAQSEYSRSTAIADSSNYASESLLQQIRNVRATSEALQAESNAVQERLRNRRAHSMEALQRAEMEYYAATGASDDCLMRSDALMDDSVRRSRREQSILNDIESRYAREGSQARMTMSSSEAANVLAGNYEYPRHHLVCNENCPFFTDPVHHRRFVIGNKYLDAAALGGFDVLFDPSVHTKSRKLLSRLSEERDVESTIYESTRESSMERGRSRSRFATRY